MKVADGFKLEGTDFQRQHVRNGIPEKHFRHGHAVVAAGNGLFSGAEQDFFHQGRGGGLAVGAGDGNDFPPVEAGSQFHFPDSLHAFPSKGFDKGAVRFNARGNHDQVRAERVPVFLRGACMQGDVFRPAGDRRRSVEYAHASAMLHVQARRGASASSRSQNGYVEVVKIHGRFMRW